MGISNPVVQAQALLGRNLERGLSRLGDYPLNKARFGLERAKTEYGINRQRELDALQRPVRELAALKAQNEADFLRTPLNIGDLGASIYGEKPSRETIDHTIANGYLQDTLKMTGSTLNPDGTITKKNGQIATGADIQRFAPYLNAVFVSKADPVRKVEQQLREAKEHYGPYGALNKDQKAWINQAEANLKNDDWKIRQYENAIQKAELARGALAARGVKNFGTIDNDIATKRGKIKAIQDAKLRKEERAFERDLKTYESESDKTLKAKQADYYAAQAEKLRAEKTNNPEMEKERIKNVIKVFEHMTRQNKESAGAVLAKVFAQQQLGVKDIADVKEGFSEKEQKILDTLIDTLSEYFGVPKTSEEKVDVNDPLGIR